MQNNKITYTLFIDDELKEFKSEIEYVFDFVDEYYDTVRVADSINAVFYGNNKTTLISNQKTVPTSNFWGLLDVSLNGIFLNGSGSDLENFILPCVENKDNTHPFDYVSIIFFFLSRIEERGAVNLDKYFRFRSEDSFSVKNNFEKRAIVDECSLELAKIIRDEDNPDQTSFFEFIPTHDMDRLKGYHHPFEPIRYFLGDIFRRRKSINTSFNRIRNSYLSGEPWKQIEFLMDVAESNNIISRFFFMGPSDDVMDSPYVTRYKSLLIKVIDEIKKRGHLVGFHPGYGTFNNGDKWKLQKNGLEEVVNTTFDIGRQHILQYSADSTPKIWNDNEMKVDYTLMYPELIGFRSGTSREYNSYDLVNRKKLKLRQVNTLVMDTGIFGGKYKDMSLELAVDETLEVIDVCKRYGGKAVILIHPAYMSDIEMEFYKKITNSL
jgi:hypothetical protein